MKRHGYKYWNGLIFALCILTFARTLVAQVEAPQTKGVYGGVISYIAAVPNDVAATRVYVTADSAAAVFYADVDFSKPNPFGTNLMFQAVPGLTSADNRSMPDGMAVHGASGRLFVSYPEGLLSSTVSSNSLVTNVAANVWGVVIEGSHLAYLRNDNRTIKLGYGTLSADGAFTESGSPATVVTDSDGTYDIRLGVHPTNHIVYINGLGKFEAGQYISFTNIVRSSDSIENLSAGTVFTPLVLPNLTTNWTGDPVVGRYCNLTFGFGPDGRIFVGGYNSTNTDSFHNQGCELIYSDDNGVMWSSAITGGSGSRLWTTVGDPANYWVYNGNAVSTNKGVNWQVFGTQVPGARLISRRVVADPTHPLVLYCVTECGVGACTNGGMTDDLNTIQNISRGIEATVINDFDLTADKNIAWIAANGIRRATNFQGIPEWSDPKFPMGNDACNYVAVDKSDTNGLTVYVGGINLYKTINGGPVESNPNSPTNWTCVFIPNVFGFNAVRMSAIEADGNIVALGLRGTANNKGALFLSTDGGTNWQEVVLNAGGVDVTELLLTRENGAAVVYATVANDYLTTAYGVFRINVADVKVTHELTDTVNMHDLAVASDGRLYASGFDTQTNVVLYSKSAGVTNWTAIPLNGYPPTKMEAISQDIPLVTVGLDSSSNQVPYMLGFERGGYVRVYAIYYMTTTGTNITWKTSDALRYSVPQIKVLFWDDLVVGTSMGLYGQRFRPNAVEGDIDGDRFADPYVVDARGNWTIWFSGSHYQSSGAIPLGQTGWRGVAGDFDGDGKADPAMVDTHGNWYIWFSGSHYQCSGAVGLGVIGSPAAGDFDGDGKADPAMVDAHGNWYFWFSGSQYQFSGAIPLGVAGSPVAGDFDKDGLADPAMVDTHGNWYIWFSGNQYQCSGAIPLSPAGWKPVVGDFDGDGQADPAMVSNNYWIFRFSGGGFAPQGPILLRP